MTVQKIEDTWEIGFERAPVPAKEQPPRAGQCAFFDEPMPASVLSVLRVSSNEKDVLLLLAAAKGGTFTVHAGYSDKYFSIREIKIVNVEDAEPAESEPDDEVAAAEEGGDDMTCFPGEVEVSIPEENLKKLNIRDEPDGEIVGKVPEGKTVSVVGECGVDAGLVASKGKKDEKWCEIDAPKPGCVMAKYLDFGAAGLAN